LENAYKQHKDNIFQYTLYLTGDNQLSEDIVHETFLKYANQKELRKDIRSIKDWLFICARNLAYNHLKKKPLNYKPIEFEQTVTIEQKIFIQEILGKLEPDERELILLREQQGYTTKEISTMLNVTDEAVRVRLFRIRKKMQVLAKE
jgi:RNA polymerase sigma-70 factor (ECF subfamily)